MKIAVTDACIFIDIHELQLTFKFFGLDIEVHTTFDVFNELYHDQKQTLMAFQLVGKLTIHSITADDREQILKLDLPKSLSESDKTVLYLANKIEAIVLSSDRSVRQQAKKMLIDYHGMLWVLDSLVETGLLNYSDASEKLKKLIQANIIYQGNADLKVEMEKRIKRWSSH